MSKQNDTKRNHQIVGIVSLIEYCGLSSVAGIRKEAIARSGGSSNNSKSKVEKSVLDTLSVRMKPCAQIMHKRVVQRIAEDTGLNLNPDNVVPTSYVRWVDFMLDSSYRSDLTTRLSSGKFIDCMYIRQAAHVANELINNYKRNLADYRR